MTPDSKLNHPPRSSWTDGVRIWGPVAASMIALTAIWAVTLNEREVRSLGFDVGLWTSLPPAVQVHITCALGSFLLGGVILLRRKGGGLHRTLGWIWVGLMSATALSSLLIMELNPGTFSLIHLLSALTLIVIPFAVIAARRRRIAAHRRSMTSLYVQALIIAGLFTLLPDRAMSLFFIRID